MKLKLLTGVALSVISINVMAEKTISEHFSSTPGFNAGIYFSHDLKKNASPNIATAHVSVTGKQGHVREFIKVDANHSIDIQNRSAKAQRYTYSYVLKCGDMSANYDRTIELDPHETFRNAAYNYGTVQKMEPGTWTIEAETTISGYESHRTRDTGNLSVYK